jgi:type IV secretion system protein VirD4
MTQNELLTMERDECIVQIIGKKPFKDKKYDITNHPRYKFHSQGEKYWFDIDKYLEALKASKESATKKHNEQTGKTKRRTKTDPNNGEWKPRNIG